MAIKLDTADTHVVLTALQIYREQEMEIDSPNSAKVDQIDRLIKSYRRSFCALARLDAL